GYQSAEGERHEHELRDRRWCGDAHQRRIVRASAIDRHAGLNEGKAKREHERIVTKFGDHRLASLLLYPAYCEPPGGAALVFFTASSFQRPCCLRLSATS